VSNRLGPGLVIALVAGFAFLYLPILVLMAFSFNESRLVTVWAGFSTRWYGELWRNRQLLDAALLSVLVAAASATIATALGTLAALALTRHRRFGGRTLLAAMLAAPLVMPEVVTGLSLLLLFVAADVERGFWTLTIAHATFTTAFACVVVQARLVGMDPTLEEAARDLGAPPWQATLTITLPLAVPGIVAAWLLAFTLSIDDVIIASFATGPGATTLPMRIYSAVRLGVSPEINAISTIMVVAVTVVVLCASLLLKRDLVRSGRE
jgi:putrescine transport system permease protein